MHKNKMRALIALLIFAFVAGLTRVLIFGPVVPPPEWRLLQTFVFIALVCWWVHEDAKATGRSVGWPLQVGLVLLPIIALPVYLFRSRGRHRGAWAVTKAMGFAALFFASLAAGFGIGHLASA